MRALIQRVNRASVTVEGKKTGEIDKGILVFLGVREEDEEKDGIYLAEKIVNLRIFEDEAGKMNLSLLEVRAKLLVVSQFTLYGNCDKGRRPSFTGAAQPVKAELLYNRFVEYITAKYDIKIQTGVFGAHMDVELINSGPVTFMIESR
jgi:D-aminoacyl-tRNA deacylase